MSFCEARHLSGGAAASEGRVFAVRLGMGMALRSGSFTFGAGLALEIGMGTEDVVSVATGFLGPACEGSEIVETGFTVTAPMRPPLGSPSEMVLRLCTQPIPAIAATSNP